MLILMHANLHCMLSINRCAAHAERRVIALGSAAPSFMNKLIWNSFLACVASRNDLYGYLFFTALTGPLPDWDHQVTCVHAE